MITGTIAVVDNSPVVYAEDGGTYSLSSCKLSKHTSGYWLFHMNLSGIYSSFREGTKVGGFINGKYFNAYSLEKN